MSLPTPPSTSHREEKENRTCFASSSTSRVVWSTENEYHILPVSPSSKINVSRIEPSASKEPPAKSILKKTAFAELPFAGEFRRETTPEPSDPLSNLQYLDGPVSRIIAPDAPMSDTIASYNELAARLRSCVPTDKEVDASWPLFYPLRQQRDAFIDALVRDLGRALTDPLTIASAREASPCREIDPSLSLPSPKGSPKKKKGMSADQVRYARDLYTTCQGVMKFLAVAFTVQGVYSIFTNAQLGFILTQVLAIPLARELPTHNARKTNALAIWLLQTQQLPTEVLAPAADRIAYALRRAIEGELGKEGKKGATADGLRAVHDLCMEYPALFVPALADLVPSVLGHLLAPTLSMRKQACYALGGMAYASTTLPPSECRSRIADYVITYLTPVDTPPPAKNGSPRSPPPSPKKDLPIIRTLRTTFNNSDVTDAAQGPAWAWCVMAAFITLMGRKVFTNHKVTFNIVPLLHLGIRHPKSSVRAIGCMVWRTLIWAYFHPGPPVDDQVQQEQDEGEEVTDSDDEESTEQLSSAVRAEKMWTQAMFSVAEMGTGAALIGTLLHQQHLSTEFVMPRVLRVLDIMTKKGGNVLGEALEIVTHLLFSFCSGNSSQLMNETLGELEPWDMQKLLTPGLFAAMPGLLTVEWRSLTSVVRELLDNCHSVDELRPLTADEFANEAVLEGFLDVWKAGVGQLRLAWGAEIPIEISAIWSGILGAKVRALQDGGNDGIALLADQVVGTLIDILDDAELNLTPESDDMTSIATPSSPGRSSKRTPSGVPPRSRWNLGLKLILVRSLWEVTCTVIAGDALSGPAEQLLRYLDRNDWDLVDEMDLPDVIREHWACLCAEVAFVCDLSQLEVFWSGKKTPRTKIVPREWSSAVRSLVWTSFVDKWAGCGASWEAGIILLGVPFAAVNVWEMSSDDMQTWETHLRLTMDRALDYGIDTVSVIDRIGAHMSSSHTPTLSSMRVVDLLLSHLDISEARQAPSDLLEFVNDTLVSSYPPEPRNKIISMWLLRTLTRVLDACPVELGASVFEQLQDGLVTWIADEYEVFSLDEYSVDVLSLYQTILLAMQSWPTSMTTLETLAPLVGSAFSGRSDKPEAAPQAFEEFWEASYAHVPTPQGGWPERIANCLCTPATGDDTSDISDDAASSILPPSSPPYSPGFPSEDDEAADGDVLETLPELLLPALVSPTLELAQTSSSTEPPSTPKGLRKDLPPTTPTRPEKTSAKDITPMFLLPSSAGLLAPDLSFPVTPKRSPQSTSRRGTHSSARQRSLSDKENILPYRAIPSVMERIALMSPEVPLLAPSTPGKRYLPDEAQEEKQAKRTRLSMPSIGAARGALPPKAGLEAAISVKKYEEPNATSQDEERTVERSLPFGKLLGGPSSAPFQREDADDLAAPPSPTPRATRKRKAMFLEAVEVPTFRQVLERRRSERTASCSPVKPSVTRVRELQTRSSLRRVCSETKVLRDLPASVPSMGTPHGKRRRSTSSEFQGRLYSSRMSALRESAAEETLVGSDDSIMLASPTKGARSSSDDDPHFGQVMPLGLASPAVRRTLDVDPPSDDSVLLNSPSRERVARKLARLPARA